MPFVDGQKVTIEYRWGHYDELPSLAIQLVRRRVAVIVAIGGEPAEAAQVRVLTGSLCAICRSPDQ